MTMVIAILGCAVLSLVNPVSLQPSHCGPDLRLTPSDDVLAGTNTPVFFFRSDKNSPLGHLIRQKDAIGNLISQSPFFKESGRRRINNNNECSQSREWLKKVDYSMECVAPSTAYPKVVVIVDYETYRRYEKESNKLTKLLEYVLAYWNGVDLNFRTLENPRLRFNIAGIIVEEHANGLPFLSEGRDDGIYFISRNLKSLEQFLNFHGPSWSQHFGRYDIVTVMTSGKVFYAVDSSGPDTIGAAKNDVICKENMLGPSLRIMFPDDEGWLRIRSLSNWLAYSFGIDDGACPKHESAVHNYLGNITKNLPDWSKCYLDALRKRFTTLQAGCYYEEPHITSPLPRVLPGQILDCNNQCKITRGLKCCERESICQDLLCQTSNGCKPIGIYAADGTSCGDGKICFGRKCVLRKDVE